MVIKEMKMHMASPEACFQAPTAEEAIQEIHNWMPESSSFYNLSLRDGIETLCLDPLTPNELNSVARLGPLNLFAIVSGEAADQQSFTQEPTPNTLTAFHYMIFQHQSLFGVEGQLVPIRNALRNWKTAWDIYLDHLSSGPPHVLAGNDHVAPEKMWKRVGFVRYCIEYWLLACLLTDRISAANHERDQARSSNRAETPQPKSAEPILDEYDQTSMRQVNDLIAGFQKFQVE